MNIRRFSIQMATLVVCALVSLEVSVLAQSTPPLEPVGEILACPTVVMTGLKPTLNWSIHYPEPEGSANYTNFIRQVNLTPGEPAVTWDMEVSSEGEMLALLAINPGYARFELWTVSSSPLRVHLLDTTTVGVYIPMASVAIRSEDPYTLIPRTRADRPFFVDVSINGLLSGESGPPPSNSATLLQHVQSYGASGTCIGLDRTQATLLHQSSITTNGTQTLTYQTNSIPGADRSKIRGEERFSVFSVADYFAEPSELDSRFIQIWPVADGSLTGITEGQTIENSAPDLTFTLNDLYPSSTTYAQVYKGQPQTAVSGTMVPGSLVAVELAAPTNKVLTVDNYDSVIDSNGVWTMELLTETPFGIDRLAHVSFLIEKDEIPQAQLAVSGNGEDIADGNISPNPGNHTDFGSTAVGGSSIVRTFTIRNTGSSPLVLSGPHPVAMGGGPYRADFMVTRQPDSPIAAGGSMTFDVTFTPGSAGPRSAVIAINCESPVESIHDFVIQGTGITHESWRQTHFGSPENTGDGANFNDFDKDRLPNLIEFAFGLDPKQNSSGMLPTPQTVGNNQVISFTQPLGVSGVTYGAEWSTTLLSNSWHPITDTAEAPLHFFSVPMEAKPSLYMRLKITSP